VEFSKEYMDSVVLLPCASGHLLVGKAAVAVEALPCYEVTTCCHGYLSEGDVIIAVNGECCTALVTARCVPLCCAAVVRNLWHTPSRLQARTRARSLGTC
jgi:hypothetical protein